MSILRSLPLLVLGFMLSTSAEAQDLEAGRRAANRGDFAEALINWAPLADWGDAEAQYNMGLLLARGDGVHKDFQKASVYFRKAAEQGHRKAASKLSTMYKFGDGVEKDPVQSDYWRKVSQGIEEIKVATPIPLPPTPDPLATEIAAAAQAAPPTPLPPIPTEVYESSSSSSKSFDLNEWILPGEGDATPSGVSSSSASSSKKYNLVPDDEDY